MDPFASTSTELPLIRVKVDSLIVSEDDNLPYTFYVIEISYDDSTWKVYRRYNQLNDFHQLMKSRYPSAVLNGLFPTKSIFTSKNDEQLVKERRLAIEQYLNHLANHPKVINSYEIEAFLETKNVRHTVQRVEAKKVLMPLPESDFDPSEVASAWKVLTNAGIAVYFATEKGDVSTPDAYLVTENSIPFLQADYEVKRHLRELQSDASFNAPIPWSTIQPESFDGIFVVGGHAPGTLSYFESEKLREKLSEFWALERPVAAIGRGVLVLARTDRVGEVNASILQGQDTTVWPSHMERLAFLGTGMFFGTRYHPYEEYCQDEVAAVVQDGGVESGPFTWGNKGTLFDDKNAWIVKSGRYLSGRWGGDAYLLAKEFSTLINNTTSSKTASNK